MKPMGRYRRQKAFYYYFITVDTCFQKVTFSSCVFINFCFICFLEHDTAYQNFCCMSCLFTPYNSVHLLSTVFLNGGSQTDDSGVRRGFVNQVCIFGVPSPQSQAVCISCVLWTRRKETFKMRLVLDLLRGRRVTLWVTAVLI